jgi:hypothetical protein
MRIAYLGLDEVNRFLARRWAKRLHSGVRFLDLRREEIPARFFAAVVDADALPGPHRRRWLARLASDGCGVPALVFGHTLTDAEAEALRGRGAKVIRRALRRQTFARWLEEQALCAA